MNDYTICFRHFPFRGLQNFIKAYPSGVCSYCDKKGHVAAISQLAAHLEDHIEPEYCDPVTLGLPVDPTAYSPKEQYYLSKILSTEELLLEELLLPEADYEKGILQDLAAYFSQEYWVKRDGAFGPSNKEFLQGGWNQFREIVKHKTRFMFFDKNYLGEYEEDSYGISQSPYQILTDVEEAIIDLGLIKTYRKNCLQLFRARTHKDDETVRSALVLGSPPVLHAKANRMSPAGISMFYGAFDENTAKIEILDPSYRGMLTLAKFTNLKEMKLIDFTNLPRVSLFDNERKALRPISRFMEAFVADLSRPVMPDDTVHIEYVPTQVVSEYLKMVMGRKYGVMGLVYNSVKNNGGRCAVLFLDNSHSIDKHPYTDPKMEIFTDMLGPPAKTSTINKLLQLDNKTIQTEYIEPKNGIY